MPRCVPTVPTCPTPTPAAPCTPTQQGGDFLAAALASGRRIRLLSVLDLFTRDALAIEVDVSLPGVRVVTVRDRLASELTGRALDAWAAERGVRLRCIAPGKPSRNGFVERCNGRFRDECLDRSWFTNVADARAAVEGWRLDDHGSRPHRALGYRTPDETRATFEARNTTTTTTTTEIGDHKMGGWSTDRRLVVQPCGTSVLMRIHAYVLTISAGRLFVLGWATEGPRRVRTLRRCHAIAHVAPPEHDSVRRWTLHGFPRRAAQGRRRRTPRTSEARPWLVPSQTGGDPEWRSPVSDPYIVEAASVGEPCPRPVVNDPPVDEERPPVCPRCHRRLVILSTQWTRDAAGGTVRRQLWGCPRGHATAYRTGGSFSPIDVLVDVVG